MKKLIFILLLLPFSLVAQTKNAKQIVIKTNLPASEGIKYIGSALLDYGYNIAAKDNDLMVIKTQDKQIGKKSFQYFLNVRVKDNEIILTGQVRSGIELSFGGVNSPDSYSDIVNKGSNGSYPKLAFNEMDAFAKSLGKEVIYN